MNDKVIKIEERITKRKLKIQGYEEGLKEEKRLLKKDEENLAHVKYDELLKKLMKNNISAEDILDKVDQVIVEKEEQEEQEISDGDTTVPHNTNNNGNHQY